MCVSDGPSLVVIQEDVQLLELLVRQRLERVRRRVGRGLDDALLLGWAPVASEVLAVQPPQQATQRRNRAQRQDSR